MPCEASADCTCVSDCFIRRKRVVRLPGRDSHTVTQLPTGPLSQHSIHHHLSVFLCVRVCACARVKRSSCAGHSSVTVVHPRRPSRISQCPSRAVARSQRKGKGRPFYEIRPFYVAHSPALGQLNGNMASDTELRRVKQHPS